MGTEGGSSAVAGLVFLYIFLALLISFCCVFLSVSLLDEDGEMEWGEVFCCCCRQRDEYAAQWYD